MRQLAILVLQVVLCMVSLRMCESCVHKFDIISNSSIVIYLYVSFRTGLIKGLKNNQSRTFFLNFRICQASMNDSMF